VTHLETGQKVKQRNDFQGGPIAPITHRGVADNPFGKKMKKESRKKVPATSASGICPLCTES